MKLQGIIFDMDGTLADTIPVCIAAFQQTFQQCLGQAFTAPEIEAMFGPNEEGMLQRRLPDTWPQALDTFLAEYERAHVICPAPFPGILPLLVTLRARGLRLGIATGKGPGSARISTRILGLEPYFDGIEVGSAEGAVKPALIRAFLTRWAVDPQLVAYVGDAPADVDASLQVGVVAVAAAWASTADASALAARQPDALFRRVVDFAAWADQVSQ
ncbi:MAG: HAD hydrolase-like protein [Chloroflexi bacterium]|nr:HAD hydrolase-like protein [Chloroflexota bacterium]